MRWLVENNGFREIKNPELRLRPLNASKWTLINSHVMHTIAMLNLLRLYSRKKGIPMDTIRQVISERYSGAWYEDSGALHRIPDELVRKEGIGRFLAG